MDKVTFDLSQDLDTSPNIFIKKEWINILDQQNGNYAGNQCIIETSALSNSNKFMNYREAYIAMPLLLTLTSPQSTSTATDMLPAAAGTSCDYVMGLKNFYGSMIHSFTVDFQGTTIVQQTPFTSMYNCFKLLTALSWNEIFSFGSQIGFYPDDPLSWTYISAASTTALDGLGTCVNTNQVSTGSLLNTTTAFNTYSSGAGNIGFLQRQQYINFDLDGVPTTGTYSALLSENSVKTMWKNYISKKQSSTGSTTAGVFQISVMATIYLRHLHSFFDKIPLAKGIFMKLTLNLNQTSTTFTKSNNASNACTGFNVTSVTSAVGGVNPLMIASGRSGCGAVNLNTSASSAATTVSYIASVAVGNQVLDSTQRTITGVAGNNLASNVYLYVPAYTFNPIYESVMLSSPIKEIKYKDLYLYQIINITANSGTINNLLTNGVSGLSEILIIPFHSTTAGTTAGHPLASVCPVYQSPFDTAGCGTTSPLCHINQFQVVVSGQNAIYNTQQHASIEQFNHHLKGTNAVNGNLTEGIGSGVINSLGFDNIYCYYNVNLERMLPVEEQVPKSVIVQGLNGSAKNCDYWCFLAYKTSIKISVLEGVRV